MKTGTTAVFALVSALWTPFAMAQEEPAAAPAVEGTSPAGEQAPAPMSPTASPEPVTAGGGETSLFTGHIYGYLAPYAEKSFDPPTAAGSRETAKSPYALDITNLNVMFQGTVGSRYRYYLNLTGAGADLASDSPIEVRNAWVETSLFGDYLTLRAGKTYRMWGLYNEILDAMPTFIGIEPPEMFDADHLMLTRMTNLIVHGQAGLDDLRFQYAISTGNDERNFDGTRDQLPFGADLRLTFKDMITIGGDYYTTGGSALPTRGVGDGSPKGGVANWMARDKYMVYGGFAQLLWEGLIVQVEGTFAKHDARRDPEKVMGIDPTTLNDEQRARFWSDPANPDASNVITKAAYDVQAYYGRVGYELALGEEATVTPYAQYDYYSNPEIVQKKTFGGDNEAGYADDGTISKYTLGAVYRPISAVALKLDASIHEQTMVAKKLYYPEVRLSFSYFWQLGSF